MDILLYFLKNGQHGSAFDVCHLRDIFSSNHSSCIMFEVCTAAVERGRYVRVIAPQNLLAHMYVACTRFVAGKYGNKKKNRFGNPMQSFINRMHSPQVTRISIFHDYPSFVITIRSLTEFVLYYNNNVDYRFTMMTPDVNDPDKNPPPPIAIS